MAKRRLLQIGVPFAVITLVATGLYCLSSRTQPQWQSPQITVRFLGLTIDAAGKKFGRFSVKNGDNRRVDVSVPGFVDPEKQGGSYWGSTNATLLPGASLETWIEAPTNRWNWRAQFLCSLPPPWIMDGTIWFESVPSATN